MVVSQSVGSCIVNVACEGRGAQVVVDAAEGACPAKHWTLATYTDLLFLDLQNNGWC